MQFELRETTFLNFLAGNKLLGAVEFRTIDTVRALRELGTPFKRRTKCRGEFRKIRNWRTYEARRLCLERS